MGDSSKDMGLPQKRLDHRWFSTVIWEHVKANSVMIFELHPDSEEKSADVSKVKFS